MNDFGNDYASIMMHEARMHEMVEKAEEKQRELSLLEKVVKPLRQRILRINNDKIR